jgi:3-methyladenine DNA glycosylase AlkD
VAANEALLEGMRASLRLRADSGRAPDMQAYMKSAMPYLGVMSTPMREACREVFATHLLSDFDEWRDTVLALWHGAQFREERYAALELVGATRYRSFRTLDALALYRELIVSGAWWDLVDGLATHEIADLLRKHPEEMRPVILDWAHGADPWLRRTAIICQVGLKRTTDRELLYACIEPNLPERGFFLRKAIGWALREYAKAEPEAVRVYVEANAARLSGLSKREALKHL